MLNHLTLRQLKKDLEETRNLPYTLFKEANTPECLAQVCDDAKHSSFWEGLKAQAAQLAESPLCPPLFSEFTLFGETGDRRTYEDKLGQMSKRLHVFSMLAMTGERKEWQEGLENAIWAICNEFTWVLPAHVGLYRNDYPNGIWDQAAPPRETVDIAAAITAFTLAEIDHMQGSRLHTWVSHRAKTEIGRRIFQVYFHSPVPQNWEMKTNNWPAVCASCIGAAAIYLIEDSEELAGMLWRVLGVLRNYLSGFDEDGATAEGPAYWQYGFAYFVYFAELLKERTCGRILLLKEEKIERIAWFPLFCMLSGGKLVNFSDSADEVRLIPGLIHRLRDYDPSLGLPSDEHLMTDIPVNWLDGTRSMLWSPFAKPEAVEEGGIQEQIFRGNQWLISKVHKPNGRMYAFAAKGGHNEEPHNHNDLGHFILHVDGKNVLADLGVGVYTKQYFQPRFRYEMMNAGSQGHSVPIVDGCRQGFGKQYQAEILHDEITDEGVWMRLDLTKAYPCASLQRLTRDFVWRRLNNENPMLTITDHAVFTQAPTTFQEVFICSVRPEVAGLGRLTMNTVTIFYDPEQWDFEMEELPQNLPRRGCGPFYRLLLHLKKPKPVIQCDIRFEIAGE
ncbi:heparinase II/III family protein [Paenibacillus sp. Soil787]|uniref:heparinase II/III family protein n=1 Tax=Paenibacillus sp. Soil787 TaxID=1736411 RepID=UPI000703B5E1|nr:heparinase II/III family protein [Paenibacillus sp. Soil787]KRF18424.1 hypothetical protein ASG93_10205 [Paenibacillus sp. Soil787]